MTNLQGASSVGRDRGSHSYAARTVSRSGPHQATSWSGGVLSANASDQGARLEVREGHDQGARNTDRGHMTRGYAAGCARHSCRGPHGSHARGAGDGARRAPRRSRWAPGRGAQVPRVGRVRAPGAGRVGTSTTTVAVVGDNMSLMHSFSSL